MMEALGYKDGMCLEFAGPVGDPRFPLRGSIDGAVWARTPGEHYEVVSSLNHPQWQAGQIVPDRIAQSAQPLLQGTARRRDGAGSGS